MKDLGQAFMSTFKMQPELTVSHEEKFNEWFYGRAENSYALIAEYFYEDVQTGNEKILKLWMETAYAQGFSAGFKEASKFIE